MRFYGLDWVTESAIDLKGATLLCSIDELKQINDFLHDVQQYLHSSEAKDEPYISQHFFQYRKDFEQGKDTDIEIVRLDDREGQ